MYLLPRWTVLPGVASSPPGIVPNSTRLGDRFLLFRATPHLQKEEMPLTRGRFDALANCHFEGLRARQGGVVSTESALEAGNSQDDLEANRWKNGEAFRSEGPPHTPVQQVGLDYFSLQHSDFQAKRGGCHIIIQVQA